MIQRTFGNPAYGIGGVLGITRADLAWAVSAIALETVSEDEALTMLARRRYKGVRQWYKPHRSNSGTHTVGGWKCRLCGSNFEGAPRSWSTGGSTLLPAVIEHREQHIAALRAEFERGFA